MGYSYEGRKLCCDGCPNAGSAEHGVRKRRCKYGYCPAPAYCRTCWESPSVAGGVPRKIAMRNYCDQHCKPASEAYARREALAREMRDAGCWLLSCARNVPLSDYLRAKGETESGLVDVTFVKQVVVPGRFDAYDRPVTKQISATVRMLATDYVLPAGLTWCDPLQPRDFGHHVGADYEGDEAKAARLARMEFENGIDL